MFSKINADTSNPVRIALRSYMKGEFLNHLSAHDQSCDGWDGAQMVIYGSTLIRQMAFNEGVKFPLEGMKSSDIDIGVVEHGRPSSTFTDNIETHICPLIRAVMVEAGFGHLPAGDMNRETVETDSTANKALAALPNEAFLGDFFATQSFDPDEIHALLKDRPDYQQLLDYIPFAGQRFGVDDDYAEPQNRPDYEQLKDHIPNGPLEVRLVLGVNENPFPVLLDPLDTTPGNGQGCFKRMRALDMMAGKLARCMTSRFKPTDLIDIYNLIKGTNRMTGDNYFHFEPGHPDGDAETLRVMLICHMAMTRGVTPTRDHLLSPLQNTPEKKKVFLDACEIQVAANQFQKLQEHTDDIFESINTMLATVMGPRSHRSYGLLNFTPDEKAFFDQIHGFREDLVAHHPKKRKIALGVGGLKITFRKGHDAHDEIKRVTVDPFLDVDRLKAAYPEVFEQYPELERNITGNGLFKNKMHEVQHGATDPTTAAFPLDI